MAFGTATVVTTKGKAAFADRVRTTPVTYTAAPKYPAMGQGATGAGRTASVSDTTLSSEVETPRLVGAESTVTTTTTGDTYQVVGTIAASSTRNIDEAGLFDAATGGNLFASATFPVIALASGDSIQFTWKVQLT